MAFESPTVNFFWLLPRIGGDIGLWGDKLNEVIGGTDGAISDPDNPLGIDGVIALIQADVDTAETDLADLDTRVTTLETAGVGAVYARIHRTASAGDLAVPQNTDVRVEFDGTSFDQGSLTAVAHSFTIPAEEGLYQLRTVLKLKFHSDGDDAFRYEAQIRRDRGGTVTVIGSAHTPFLNDGVSSDSGDITLLVETLVVAETDDVYEVFIRCEEDGSSPVGAVRGGATETYFEAARLAPTS